MFLNSAPLDEYLITHLWHHHILLKTCKGCKNVHSEHINQKKARKNPLCTAWTNAAHALPRSVPTLPVESILITTCHNNNQKKIPQKISCKGTYCVPGQKRSCILKMSHITPSGCCQEPSVIHELHSNWTYIHFPSLILIMTPLLLNI